MYTSYYSNRIVWKYTWNGRIPELTPVTKECGQFLILTIVDAFLQLANATRLVGFDVMQFTMDLDQGTTNQSKLKTLVREKVQFFSHPELKKQIQGRLFTCGKLVWPPSRR